MNRQKFVELIILLQVTETLSSKKHGHSLAPLDYKIYLAAVDMHYLYSAPITSGDAGFITEL